MPALLWKHTVTNGTPNMIITHRISQALIYSHSSYHSITAYTDIVGFSLGTIRHEIDLVTLKRQVVVSQDGGDIAVMELPDFSPTEKASFKGTVARLQRLAIDDTLAAFKQRSIEYFKRKLQEATVEPARYWTPETLTRATRVNETIH